MSEDLDNLLDQVSDEKSFIKFISALGQDWEDSKVKETKNPSSPWGSSANGWESGSIGAFLESASAWASDTLDKKELINSWQKAARIIYAGKYYE